MITRILTLAAAFLLTLCSLASAKQPETKEHSIFWRITRPGSNDTSYLFGTLHLLEKSYVDTMRPVMKALEESNVMVGELVVDSIDKSELLSSTTMKESLQSLMSKKDYSLVNKAIERVIGLPASFLSQFRPVVIYAMLLEGMYQKAHPENHKSGVPMDLYFQNVAKASGKSVLGLETAQDQADVLFDSTPVKEQAKQLLDLVKHTDKAMRDMNKMLTDYSHANIASIMTDPDMNVMSKKEMDELVYDRNARWLLELPEILDHHRTFIAVGAGHLVGNHGLIAGLRKLGYTVAPVGVN